MGMKNECRICVGSMVLICAVAMSLFCCGGASGSGAGSGGAAGDSGANIDAGGTGGASGDAESPSAGNGSTDSGSSGTGGETGGDGASGDGADGSTVDDSGSGGDAGHPDPVPYEPECADLPSTQVIGNWDVVPYQTFDERFQLGVVAFHEQGVDVVFSVGGNEVDRVENPTWNGRTSVYEYWTALEASDYPDGPITVSAVIEPDCPGHESRALEDLTLFANSGGTLTNDTIAWVDCAAGNDNSSDGSESSPYATIEKALVEVGSGGTVYLKAGLCYELTSLYPEAAFDRWTTVQPAPGVTRQQVQILADSDFSSTATGRFAQNMVRWKNVGIFSQSDANYSTVLYLESGHHGWLDGAELYEKEGAFAETNPWSGGDGHRVYLTDAHLHNLTNAGFTFGRDVLISDIASDVFRARSDIFSVNLTVRDIDPGESEAHPDFFQFYDPDGVLENVVIYNTVVTNMDAQGIFGGPGSLSDVAFVNLLMEKDPADSASTSQLTGNWNHVLLWHVTTVDSGFLLREVDNLNNFFIQNGSFHSLHHGSETTLPGFTIDHNRFATLIWSQQNGPMGSNASEGDPGYADVGNDNYRPAPDSPLCGAGVPLPGVPADVEGNLYHPATPALGAFACR